MASPVNSFPAPVAGITPPTAPASPTTSAFRFAGAASQPSADSFSAHASKASSNVRFGLFGKKKLEQITPPDGQIEQPHPGLWRRAERALKRALPWAIATLILTPFKFVPVINLLAIPAGLLTSAVSVVQGVGGALDKRSRVGKEKPIFIPDPALASKGSAVSRTQEDYPAYTASSHPAYAAYDHNPDAAPDGSE